MKTNNRRKLFIAGGAVLVLLVIFASLFGESEVTNAAFGKVTKKRCRLLKSWYDQGVLTENLEGDISQARKCERKYPRIWYGEDSAPVPTGRVTKKRCKLLKKWYDQGVLTENLEGDISQARKCERKYPRIWYGSGSAPAQAQDTKIPSAKRCRLLKSWLDEGTLTENLEGNISQARKCEKKYPRIWYDEDFEPAPTPPMEETELPSADRCRTLRAWLDEGTLTDNLDGDISEARACSRDEPYIWSGHPSADRCRALRSWLDEGTLTDNLDGDISEARACSRDFPAIWF